MADSKGKIAYFCSLYPAISHTFINREIQQLEQHGFDIHPFTMNPGQVLAGGTAFEQEQLERTYCIKKQSPLVAVGAQISQLLRHPVGYLAGLWLAVSLQKGRLKETLWALFHFMEGAILAREMRKRGIEHVHVHFANSEAAIAMYMAHAFGFTYSFTLHGPDCFYNVGLGHLEEKIKRAKFILAISHFARGQAVRLGGQDALKKTYILRCGVDPERYAPVGTNPPEPLHIVCTGRLTATKGQMLLVMACDRLKQSGRKFRCTLIGGGDQEQQLRQMVKEMGLENEVVLTGALPQDGVLETLKTAHLFCLPSFAEGVPVVLMEAMSMEIPCIGTRVGGIAELIDSPHNSWLIHSGDPEGLFLLLQDLVDHPDKRAGMGNAARETILEHFNIHKNGKKLAGIFEKENVAS